MRRKKHHAALCVTLAAGWLLAQLPARQSIAAELPAQVEGSGSPAVVPNAYDAQTITSFAALPSSVQDTVTQHLRDRLGDAYFSRLSFHEAQIATLKMGKDAGGVRMFSYRIAFDLSDHEKGIARYTSDLWLDTYGQVMREIELPAVKASPEKAAFAPLTCAYKVGASLGITPTAANLGYDAKTDSIVYILRQETEDTDTSGAPGSNGCIIHRRIATISAHTCKLLHNDTGYTRPYSCATRK